MEGHNRKLNRWPGYDYSQSGLYFITICTHKRIEWFGRVENGEMILNQYGRIVRDCWLDLPNHYSNCKLDEFVIMPNHVHGIIVVTDGRERSVTVPPDDNRVIRRMDATTQSPDGDRNGYKPFPTGDRNGLKPFPTGHGLSEIVRGFKTFSSKRINALQNEFQFRWQKSFHDRVIRNNEELNGIRVYIAHNPSQWQFDRNNPKLGAVLPSK